MTDHAETVREVLTECQEHDVAYAPDDWYETAFAALTALEQERDGLVLEAAATHAHNGRLEEENARLTRRHDEQGQTIVKYQAEYRRLREALSRIDDVLTDAMLDLSTPVEVSIAAGLARAALTTPDQEMRYTPDSCIGKHAPEEVCDDCRATPDQETP